MTSDPDISIRVTRLLKGEQTPRDLDRLFTWLRSRSFGNRLVAEIGHFAAHPEPRDRGAARSAISLYLDYLKYALPRCMAQSLPTTRNPVSTKEEFEKAAFAAIELMPPKQIKPWFGLGKAQAIRIARSAFDKIANYDGTDFKVSTSWSPEEYRIIQVLCGLWVNATFFNHQSLVEELYQSLLRNKLIKINDKRALYAQEDWLSVYALEKMHLSQIQASEGHTVVIQSGYDITEPDGILFAGALLVGALPQPTFVPVFATKCRPSIWCEPTLITGDLWDFPVELGAQNKLQIVR